MKKKWIIIAILAVMGLTFLTIGAISSGRGMIFMSGENEFIEVRDTEPITSIYIGFVSSNIRFVESDSFGYEISHKSEKNIHHSISDGVLRIEERLRIRFINFDFRREREYVNVFLPSDVSLDTVEIRTTSGNTNIGSFECEKLIVRLTSGNTTINNVTAKNAELRMTSGNINATDFNTNGMNVNITSGRASLSGRFTGTSNFNLTSGNLNLTIDGEERDYNRNMRITSGRVNVNGNRQSTGNTSIGGLHDLDIRITSGNVEINFIR
jgi:DUF4097 and DUF4098 domain-containing protein YvlB